MNELLLPRSRRLPISPHRNGGGAWQCLICDVGELCLAHGHEQQVHALDLYVERAGPYPRNAFLFREGDPMSALMVVRTGTVKLYITEPSGEEQVLGFALVGDVFGLEAIHSGRYGCNARVLETTSLCRLPLTTVTQLTAAVSQLQRSLLNLLSRHIDKTHLLIGRYEAEQRLAAFLMLLSRHAQRHGLSPHRLHLGMSCTDIANYLRLTPETISRVLRRFQQRQLVGVCKREIELLDRVTLSDMSRAVLRD